MTFLTFFLFYFYSLFLIACCQYDFLRSWQTIEKCINNKKNGKEITGHVPWLSYSNRKFYFTIWCDRNTLSIDKMFIFSTYKQISYIFVIITKALYLQMTCVNNAKRTMRGVWTIENLYFAIFVFAFHISTGIYRFTVYDSAHCIWFARLLTISKN